MSTAYFFLATLYTNTVDSQNHGGLAVIHRDSVRFHKLTFDVNISTLEYLCGFATTSHGQFLLLAVYRPGSQAVYCDVLRRPLKLSLLEQMTNANVILE